MKSKADNPARKEGIRPSEVLHPNPIERARVSGGEKLRSGLGCHVQGLEFKG